MLTKKNVVMLEGGLTKDAEHFADAGVVHLSMAIDGSGSEKGVPNAAGYFDVKVWLTPSKYSPAALGEYVKSALTEGSLVKGTRIGLVGRLVQERWKGTDGKMNSRVVVMAESLDIFASKKGNSTTESVPTQAASTAINDF